MALCLDVILEWLESVICNLKIVWLFQCSAVSKRIPGGRDSVGKSHGKKASGWCDPISPIKATREIEIETKAKVECLLITSGIALLHEWKDCLLIILLQERGNYLLIAGGIALIPEKEWLPTVPGESYPGFLHLNMDLDVRPFFSSNVFFYIICFSPDLSFFNVW